MKTTLAYEIFYFLKVFIFNDNFWMLYIRNIVNMIFKWFTKWCFTLWFYNFTKKMSERKKKDDTFLKKKNRKVKNKIGLPLWYL